MTKSRFLNLNRRRIDESALGSEILALVGIYLPIAVAKTSKLRNLVFRFTPEKIDFPSRLL